ncbi:MAG: hypothetical protein IH936_13810 [Acidobacteria bacterium]|nr:hypothetical protein [Acidobacteriota bacterium]
MASSARTPPWAARTDIPNELEALILGLLDPEPSRRPSSAAKVVARLEDLVRARNARWIPPVAGPASPSSAAGGSSDGAGYLPTIRLSELAPS